MTKLVPLIGLAIGLGVLAWYDRSEQGTQEPIVSDQVLSAKPAGLSDTRSAMEAGSVGDRPGVAANAALDVDEWSADGGSGSGDAEPALPHMVNPLATLDKEELSQTVQRPLFAPSRKRPPPAKQKAVATKVAPDEYELLGIAKSDNQAIVLVRRLADGLNFRVQAGDMVGGSQLAKVDGNAIVLKRSDGTSRTIQLGARKSKCLNGGVGSNCRRNTPKPPPPFYLP